MLRHAPKGEADKAKADGFVKAVPIMRGTEVMRGPLEIARHSSDGLLYHPDSSRALEHDVEHTDQPKEHATIMAFDLQQASVTNRLVSTGWPCADAVPGLQREYVLELPTIAEAG